MKLRYLRVWYNKGEWSRGEAWANLLGQKIPGCPKPVTIRSDGSEVVGHGWVKDHNATEWAWVYWGFPDIRPPYYVTITAGIRGHFAVLLALTEDEYGEFYEPLNSGIGSYASAAKAIPEALEWASAEGVPFILEGYDHQGQPLK